MGCFRVTNVSRVIKIPLRRLLASLAREMLHVEAPPPSPCVISALPVPVQSHKEPRLLTECFDSSDYLTYICILRLEDMDCFTCSNLYQTMLKLRLKLFDMTLLNAGVIKSKAITF